MTQMAPMGRAALSHRLPGPLVVSLTSYAPRFATLHLTLRNLLSQTVRADATILWVSSDDFGKLPARVTRLTSYGLEIRQCDDIGSYKKLVPALKAFPDAHIVTADDDLYVDRHWLESLLSAHAGARAQITCHRAHLIKLNSSGLPLPYLQWEIATREIGPSRRLFPTSGAGTIFPPGIFDGEVLNVNAFTSLAPTADDVWFYWMASRNGATFKRTPQWRRLVPWPSSQKVNLWSRNVRGVEANNDTQIAHMIQAYGLPNFDDSELSLEQHS
jgi:hypothetical protein